MTEMGHPQPCRAVIFDLFGTLVDTFAVRSHGAYHDAYDARRPEVEGWRGLEIATAASSFP